MKKIMILMVVVAVLGISASQIVSAVELNQVQTQEQAMQQDNQFTEIKVTELPAAVSKAISDKYPGYKAEKAYKGKDGSYKVTIGSTEEKLTLYYNEKGEFLKIEK